MSDQERVCLHGSLRRQCEPCDLAARLEVAEAEIARLKAPPDQERLRAIAEREQQATKGPWFTGPHYKADVHEPGGGVIRANCWQAPQGIADAQFIANARQDVPYLLSLVAQQAQEIQDLRTEREHDKALIDLMARSTSPCGHWSAHAVIVDPELKGRQIECLDCKADRLSSSCDALREANAELRDLVRLAVWRFMDTKHAGGETRRLPLEKAQRMREIAKLAETPTEDRQ